MSVCKTSLFLIYLTSLVNTTGATAQTRWISLKGPYAGDITVMTVDRQGNCYAASQFTGVHRSTDAGASWNAVNNGLDWSTLSTLAADSSNSIYAGSIWTGLFRSTDNGTTWRKTKLAGGSQTARVISGNRLCVGGSDSVSISTDQGESWSTFRVSDTTVNVISLAEDKAGNIYAGLPVLNPRHSPPYGGGVYISSDSGKTWKYYGMALDSIKAIAIGKSNDVFISNSYTVFSAGMKDSNWVQNAIGLPHSGVAALSNSSSGDVVAAIGGGLYMYNENTHSWDVVLGSGLSSTSITSFYYNPGGISYAGTSRNGIFKMSDPQESWVQCGILAATTTAVSFDQSGNLYVGTDDGIYKPAAESGTWIRASDGLVGGKVYQIDTVNGGSGIFAATSGGLFYSRDAGISWTSRTSAWSYSLDEAYSGTLYVGTTGGVLSSINEGVNWSHVTSVGFPVSTVYSVLADQGTGTVFAGTANNGVFATTDGGYFWSQTGISSPFMFCSIKALAQATTVLRFDGNSISTSSGPIYAGTDTAGAFYSQDSGENWTHIPSITASNVSCFLMKQQVLTVGQPIPTNQDPMFAGTLNGGVFVSTDGGYNWNTMDEGLPDSSVSSLAIDRQGFLYAATDSGVYKTVGTVTVVSAPESRPQSFSLSQNYPNPFNPITTISYQLSAVSRVNLKVYDILGREVVTLVDGMKQQGYYTVQFDGGRLASGVYFYRMVVVPQSDQGGVKLPFVETKKMVLIK